MAWDVQTWQASAGSGWDTAKSWSLIEGQTTYLLDVPFLGDEVDTLLQWGALTLIPTTDYQVSGSSLVLVSAPSAEQASAGQPLVLRYRGA